MLLPIELIQEVVSFLPIDDFARMVEHNIFSQASELEIYYGKLLLHNFGLTNCDDIAKLLNINYRQPIVSQLLDPVVYHAVSNNDETLLLTFITQIMGRQWKIEDEILDHLHISIICALCRYGNVYLYDKLPQSLQRYIPNNYTWSHVYRWAVLTACKHRQIQSIAYFLDMYGKYSTNTSKVNYLRCKIFSNAIIQDDYEMMAAIGHNAQFDFINIGDIVMKEVIKKQDGDLDRLLKFIRYTQNNELYTCWHFFLEGCVMFNDEYGSEVSNVLEQAFYTLYPDL